jgi:hypothetical protein
MGMAPLGAVVILLLLAPAAGISHGVAAGAPHAAGVGGAPHVAAAGGVSHVAAAGSSLEDDAAAGASRVAVARASHVAAAGASNVAATGASHEDDAAGARASHEDDAAGAGASHEEDAAAGASREDDAAAGAPHDGAARTAFHFQPRRNWMNDPNGKSLVLVSSRLACLVRLSLRDARCLAGMELRREFRRPTPARDQVVGL